MIGSCPECNGKLSSNASTCPHCGHVQNPAPQLAVAPAASAYPAKSAGGSFLDPKKNLKVALQLSLIVLLLMAVIGVFFGPQTCTRLMDSAATLGKGAGKVAEVAIMRPGTYTVQLEWVDLADADWTKDSVFGGPKNVRLLVSVGNTTLVNRNLGAFRGRKTFTEQPITFQVQYDGRNVIALRFEEVVVLSQGVQYEYREPWPFSHVKAGSGTTFNFSWK